MKIKKRVIRKFKRIPREKELPKNNILLDLLGYCRASVSMNENLLLDKKDCQKIANAISKIMFRH